MDVRVGAGCDRGEANGSERRKRRGRATVGAVLEQEARAGVSRRLEHRRRQAVDDHEDELRPGVSPAREYAGLRSARPGCAQARSEHGHRDRHEIATTGTKRAPPSDWRGSHSCRWSAIWWRWRCRCSLCGSAAPSPSATPACARSPRIDHREEADPRCHRRPDAVDARGHAGAQGRSLARPSSRRARALPPRDLDLPVADTRLPLGARDGSAPRRARDPASRLVPPGREAARRVRLVVWRP